MFGFNQVLYQTISFFEYTFVTIAYFNVNVFNNYQNQLGLYHRLPPVCRAVTFGVDKIIRVRVFKAVVLKGFLKCLDQS